MNGYVTNSGKRMKSFACGACTAVAAGTGDNTAVTGATIDRTGFQSGKLAVTYRTSLTAAKTLSIQAELQESSDGSSWDTASVLQAATVEETGAVTNKVGVVDFAIDLSQRKQYIRFNFTPDLSHSGTDTVDAAAVFMAAGAVEEPTSAS